MSGDQDPDRWKDTSFADSTEAAIHYALIVHVVRCNERESGRPDPHVWPDASDIYIQTRRLVRDLATGKIDPDKYLEEETDK